MSTDELRSKKVAKNAFWAISGYLVYALAGFVSRMFFVTKLGDTITGVATLFNSMMGLISLTELGFSTAIAYHLYKPVAENDERKISALLNLYSKTYKIIGCIILAIGLSVTPIINFFVKNELHIENLRLYFFLYVVQSALSYFYSYTTILFTVTQKSYVSSNITNSFLLGTTVLQILVLQFTQSYLLYLIVWIIGTFSSNLLIYFNAGKRYPYIKKYKDEKLAPGEVKEVFRYVRATALDKISLSVKASTDNMIISKFVDIVLTGKIGNYTMIINTVRILLNFFYSSVTPSMGNFILTENKKKQYDAILTLQLITFWLFGFLSAGMMCTLPVFVSDVWLHSRTYILPFEITCLLVTDFFLVGISIPSNTVFTLKGYIRQIPYINLLNVLVNLIISLRLVGKYGVVGIYIGTILSHLLTTGLIQPYFVFGRHFEGDIAPFAKVFVKGFSVTVFTAVISFVAAGCVSTGGIVGIVFRAAVCTVIFNGIFIAVYFRDKYFKSVVGIVRNILRI